MKRNSELLGREDSYWNQLTPEQQDQLRRDLLDTNTPYAQLVARAPVWPVGPRQGQPPSHQTLRDTARRLRALRAMAEVSATLGGNPSIVGPLEDEFVPAHPKAIFDTLLPILGQEILVRTLHNLDPAARTAALRLLLQREDQRIHWARYHLARERLAMDRRDRKAAKDKKNPNHAEGCITKEQWEQLERELNLM